MKIGDKVVVKKEGAIHSCFILGEVVSIVYPALGGEGFYATNGRIEQLLFVDQVEMYKEDEF